MEKWARKLRMLGVAALVIASVAVLLPVVPATAEAATDRQSAVSADQVRELSSPPPAEAGVEASSGFGSTDEVPTSEKIREFPELRSATTSTWENTDGTRSVEVSALPQFFQPRDSKEWLPIDSDLVADASKPGRLRSGANRWTSLFGPSDSADGMQQMVTDSGAIAFTPVDGRDGVEPQAKGPVASYEDLWPETDAVYTVTPVGTEERLVLSSKEAPDSFAFDVSGADLKMRDDGGVDLVVAGAVAATIPAPTVETTDGPTPPADAGARYSIESTETAGSGEAEGSVPGLQRLRVSIDQGWLDALKPESFPVVIDPSVYSDVYTTQAVSYPSPSGSPSSGALWVGNNTATGKRWRAKAYIPIPNPSQIHPGGTQPWYLVSAQLHADVVSGQPSENMRFYGLASEPFSYSAITSGQAFATNAGASAQSAMVTSWLAGQSGAGAWYGLTGDEVNTTWDTYESLNNLRVQYTYYQSPEPTFITSPSGTISTTTPMLEAQQVGDTGESVYYDFKVSTDQAGTGSVIDSGWVQSRTWKVPEGALADGATYYVRVQSGINAPWWPGNPEYVPPAAATQVKSFTIKSRLGGGGPAPTDTVGSVPGSTSTPSEGAPSPGTSPASVTVNMVTGNVSLGVNTHPLPTAGGSTAGVTLNYDSLGTKALTGGARGLYGRYSSGGQSIGQRLDPAIDFKWTGSPMGGQLPASSVGVEWNGVVTIPASGTWKLGGTVGSGTMNIYVDGSSTAYTTVTSTGQPTYGGALSWSPGSQHGIRVTYDTTAANQAVQLWAQNTAPAAGTADRFVVPGSWLKPRATSLPAGWSLSANPYSGSWTRLEDLGTQVIAHSATGETATFTRRADGTYQPPAGSDALLTVRTREPWLSIPSGPTDRYQLQSGENTIFTFGQDLMIQSVTTLSDDRQPAALQYTYQPLTGVPGAPVLTEVRDPVSNRAITLCYGPSCTNGAGGWTVPDGMLGRIDYWDTFGGASQTTSLRYNASGQLVRVVNPGNAVADFAYNTEGRLSSIRDPLANDAIAAGQRSDCLPSAPNTPTCSTEIYYNTVGVNSGKVSNVYQPAPTVGGKRPRRIYSYPIGQNTGLVTVEGLSANDALTSSVSWDSQSRITSKTDPAGRVTTTKWDPNIDRPVATVDAAGLQTTSIYDTFSQVLTDSYGPAPSTCFDSSFPFAPTGSCSTPVPRTQHRYDEGLTTLAATFWDNPYLAGAPSLHSTGPAAPSCGGLFCATWDTLPVSPGGQSLPMPSQGHSNTWTWSARFAGTIDAAYAWDLSVETRQNVIVYLDGVYQQTVDAVESGLDGGIAYGVWNSNYWRISVPAGRHTIQLDYRGSATTANGLALSSYPANVFNLSPGYGLETTTIDADGKTTATAFADSTRGIGPEFKLPTAVTKDPGGLSLITSTQYETPGQGRYLRKTAGTLPAGNATTYRNYCGTPTTPGCAGDTQQQPGAFATACGVTVGAPQYGFMAEKRQPDADAAHPGRTEQFLYDDAGRQVGRRVAPANLINAAAWECTTYDQRGRTLTQTWPAQGTGAPARTVTYSYAISGDPLTTRVTEGSTSITSTVDLLGRAVSYTDATGYTTRSTYDKFGRVTQLQSGPGASTTKTITNAYDIATGELHLTTAVAGTTTLTATATYDGPSGRLTAIDYTGGTAKRMSQSFDTNGRRYGVQYTNQGSLLLADVGSFSPAGRRLEGLVQTSAPTLVNPNPAGPEFEYDGAGRLTRAYLVDTRMDISYTPNTAGCANPGAGANTNRSAVTMTPSTGSPTTTDYCYNTADQLVSATATPAGFSYDNRGNQTSDGVLAYTWDASNRLASATPSAGTTVTYTRDPLDRLYQRSEPSGTTRYAYSGYGDTPTATLNTANQVLQEIVALPGGATATIDTTPTVTWSYPNLQGHTAVTTDNNGTLLAAPTAYDPWGVPYNAVTTPNNLTGTAELAAYGNAGKLQETGTNPIIHMGARPFSPTRGRFLSTDPIEGGCANSYVYAYGDPLNTGDLSGKNILGDIVGGIADAARGVARGIADFVSRNACTIADIGEVVATVAAIGAVVVAVVGSGGSAALLAIAAGGYAVELGAGIIADDSYHKINGGIGLGLAYLSIPTIYLDGSGEVVSSLVRLGASYTTSQAIANGYIGDRSRC